MTAVVAGAITLVFHVLHRQVLVSPAAQRRPDLLPNMRSLSSVLGVLGIVLIALGVLFPRM